MQRERRTVRKPQLGPGALPWLVLSLWLVPGLEVCGQTPVKPKPAPKKQQEPPEFWFDPRRQQPAAAAEIILAQEPFTVLAMRIRGKALVVWGELEEAAEEAPPLNRQWLSSARERDGKPLPNFIGRAPDEITRAEKDNYRLYNQALVFANNVPAEAFAKSARENDYITFSHMYLEPWKHRGKVIPIEGRLKRLYKRDAPKAAQAQGVRYLYEGWVSGQTYGSHPFVLIFPILPDGLKPAENMDRWVEFNGYLINRYRYHSQKGDLETLLLIGPTLKLGRAPATQRPDNVISPVLLYGFVGFVCTVAIFMVLLSWWFRRGDQRVRDRLKKLQAERTLEMLENPAVGQMEEEKP